MNTLTLLITLLTACACLAVQYFKLDERLDAWLARRIESTRQTGDDGCYLDCVKVAGWLSAFAVYVVVNLIVF